jgi:hypothetical protein
MFTIDALAQHALQEFLRRFCLFSALSAFSSEAGGEIEFSRVSALQTAASHHP